MPREKWGAQPPTRQLDRLIWPATHLNVTFTKPVETCKTEKYIKAVQSIQARDMNELYRPDIQYK